MLNHAPAARPVGLPQIAYEGLRDWIALVQGRLPRAELRTVTGASSEADIGAITEMLDHTSSSPCVLFDEIPGYPRGHRVIVNCNGTAGRQAITLGLDPRDVSHQVLLDFWKQTLDGLRPLPPVEVTDAPVLENVQRGDEANLLGFPAPIWHPGAGGRDIGTASITLLRDPDTGRISVGAYRTQVLDRGHLGVWISPDKQGHLVLQKYFDRGEPCPIVVVVGSDPLLLLAASSEAPSYGMDELDWAGAVRGSPVPVIRGETTGLPIPAYAEIAIEGWIHPTERRPEGPWGEADGYYSRPVQDGPFVKVDRVYHRDQPIIVGRPGGKPPHEESRSSAYLRSHLVHQQLRGLGVSNVTGVWVPPEAGQRGLVVVAIKQSFPGHAMQAGLAASQAGGAAHLGRYVVVVDDDIDIYNMDDVWFAMFTRVDPQREVHLVERSWSGPLDPAIHPDARGMSSRAIFDATRPWEWKDRFAEPVVTAEMSRASREKWGWLLEGQGR